PPVVDALLAGASVNLRQGWPSSYQNASCTEPSGPIHQTSMVLGLRDTAAMALQAAALPAGASGNEVQLRPSYQNESHTEPSAPIHQISMLFGILDTAAT